MATYNQQYPIGEFQKPDSINEDLLTEWIAIIAAFPTELEIAVQGLRDEQLDTPYRPAGWTVRQLVHHCADSHMNAFCRIKLALTEDNPVIKPYLEDRWAELVDSKLLPIASSLAILHGLHLRWATLLQSLHTADLEKTFVHPATGRTSTLEEVIGMYAWHSRHHLAHITTLKKNLNW